MTFMSQQKLLNCLRKYAILITEKMSGKYIRFPQTASEIKTTKTRFNFLEDHGFPNIIGVIDGIQIALTRLKKEVEHAYVNRKGYHSINTQLVCDDNLRILNCKVRYCGSIHESYVFVCSQSFAFLQIRYIQGERRKWLLGDIGYLLQPLLLNAVKNYTARRILQRAAQQNT